MISTLAGICVFTAVLMALQDTLGTALVVAESQNVGKVAGIADGLKDYASKYGTVIAAYAVTRWGPWTWQTFLIVSVSALTSVVVTPLVTTHCHRLLPKFRSKRKDQPCPK